MNNDKMISLFSTIDHTRHRPPMASTADADAAVLGLLALDEPIRVVGLEAIFSEQDGVYWWFATVEVPFYGDVRGFHVKTQQSVPSEPIEASFEGDRLHVVVKSTNNVTDLRGRIANVVREIDTRVNWYNEQAVPGQYNQTLQDTVNRFKGAFTGLSALI